MSRSANWNNSRLPQISEPMGDVHVVVVANSRGPAVAARRPKIDIMMVQEGKEGRTREWGRYRRVNSIGWGSKMEPIQILLLFNAKFFAVNRPNQETPASWRFIQQCVPNSKRMAHAEWSDRCHASLYDVYRCHCRLDVFTCFPPFTNDEAPCEIDWQRWLVYSFTASIDRRHYTLLRSTSCHYNASSLTVQSLVIRFEVPWISRSNAVLRLLRGRGWWNLAGNL